MTRHSGLLFAKFSTYCCHIFVCLSDVTTFAEMRIKRMKRIIKRRKEQEIDAVTGETLCSLYLIEIVREFTLW